MKRFLPALMVLFAMAAACSSPEPPQRFLTAPMRLITLENGQNKAEPLRLRPVDLYNVFDTNVKKKWKKVHENSWTIVIDGRDPSNGKISRMTMTLSVDPGQNDAVVVTEIKEGGVAYSTDAMAIMLRQINSSYSPARQ